MPPRSKIVKCVDCRKEFPRKLLNRHCRCEMCAWDITAETMHQLHQHSGPLYEHWQAACKAKASRYLEGIGSP